MEKRVFKVRSALLAQNGADIVYVNHESHLQQAKADSALLAAAPDLLAALETLCAAMACHDKTPEEFNALVDARDAIKKANGE